VRPGQFITAEIDGLMLHDSAAAIYKTFKELGIPKVWDSSKVVAVNDHKIPARNIDDAELDKIKRAFVKEFEIAHWYDVGRGGICHQVFPEQGHALPGTLVLGCDSHTTSYGAFNVAATGTQIPEAYWVAAKGNLWFRVPETIRFELAGELPRGIAGKDVVLKIAGEHGTDFAGYKSIEFVGRAVEKMSLSNRWAIANMGVDLAARFAIFEADDKVFQFLKGRTQAAFTPVKSDPDAGFERTYQLDVSDLVPQVACPHDLGNVKPVTEVAGIPFQQAFIGSCTGGRLEDLVAAAEIMKGKKVHPGVRMVVIPASVEVYKDALRTGLVEIFADADAVVAPPGCGPCSGHHLGILGAGERCVSASNRNVKGRMGSPDAEIYLASPATVAASAIAGVIADPREI
jgi:3-isopropylmalate/(R)-2-methylmalate dehydratase large subunit